MKLLFISLFFVSVLFPHIGFAESKTCQSLFAQTDHEILVEVYEQFLEKLNEHLDEAPKTVMFKGQEYKVIDLLGSGIEGVVVRVEDSSGKKSIMKIFIYSRNHILRQAWDYYKMNKGSKYPYTVVAIDYKNKIFQFEDMRGLPLRRLSQRLSEAGAPERIAQRIFGLLAMVGTAYYDQNVLYDIDRQVLIAIDPH
jgi:hypothetical protein